MIFRPMLAREVLAGRKTVTRRVIKPDEGRSRYKPGRSYAVQPGRGRPQICRIIVLAVEQERLGDLTQREAIREGFKTTEAFFDYWRGLHGTVDLELVVWVIRFELDRSHTPRFLHRHSERGYTTSERDALPGEGEAVDEATLTAFAKDNERRFREHRNAELTRTLAGDLGAARRLQRMRDLALRHGVNIRDDVQVIERAWSTLDADRLERRLAAIEKKLRVRIVGEREAA